MINQLRYPLCRKPKMHFLHIGKTGGSAAKTGIGNYLLHGHYKIYLHEHRFSLEQVPRGEKVFFFLRDPISRFVSGFYSRQRKGLPRYENKWSEGEAKAFKVFTTPNALASALADGEGDAYLRAIDAMHAIKHVNHYSDWFKDLTYFETRLDDIFYIGFQENLSQDFPYLISALGLPDTIHLSDDEIIAHKNPDNLDKNLEQRSIVALQLWYQKDFEFYTYCRSLKKNKI